MTRGLTIAVLVLLVACGRTEPVSPRPEPEVDAGQPEHQATPVPALDADAGVIIGGACTGPDDRCPRGFHCESGVCVLNGDNAELQVTLQWQNTPRTNDDLDLHLIEPLRGGATCEIYFGSTGLFGCGAVGQLDLDANGACVDTDPSGGPGADTENIIYPPGQAAPVGHYIVRVDFWGSCSGSDVPFVLTVRKGSTVSRRTGVFRPDEADSGDQNSGRTMLEFDVP